MEAHDLIMKVARARSLRLNGRYTKLRHVNICRADPEAQSPIHTPGRQRGDLRFCIDNTYSYSYLSSRLHPRKALMDAIGRVGGEERARYFPLSRRLRADGLRRRYRCEPRSLYAEHLHYFYNSVCTSTRLRRRARYRTSRHPSGALSQYARRAMAALFAISPGRI